MNGFAMGERLEMLLKENGVKQKELASAIGVLDNMVSYFVRGTRTPNVKQIMAIADFFGVSADYLLGRTDVKTTDTSIKEISEYTGLSEENIEALHRSKESSEPLNDYIKFGIEFVKNCRG